MAGLTEKQEELCEQSRWNFSDLKAIYINCTLKRSPEPSHTHLARMIKDAGGVPAHGNQRTEWDAGCRFDYPNPEHR